MHFNLFPSPSCCCFFNLSNDVLLTDSGEKGLLGKNCLDSDWHAENYTVCSAKSIFSLPRLILVSTRSMDQSFVGWSFFFLYWLYRNSNYLKTLVRPQHYYQCYAQNNSPFSWYWVPLDFAFSWLKENTRMRLRLSMDKGVLKERRGHVTEKSVLQLVVIPHSARKMESTFLNFRWKIPKGTVGAISSNGSTVEMDSLLTMKQWSMISTSGLKTFIALLAVLGKGFIEVSSS